MFAQGGRTTLAQQAQDDEDLGGINQFDSQSLSTRPGLLQSDIETVFADVFTKPPNESEGAADDWFEFLSWREDYGISLEMEYQVDYFINTYGGLNTSKTHNYAGFFDIFLTLDMEKLGLWKGGTILLNFEEVHGRSISKEHVGDLQGFCGFPLSVRTQLTEYWYKQKLFDDKLWFKLGKMDANVDFAYVKYGFYFANYSAFIPPLIPMPTVPYTALGIALFVEPADWFYVGGGVYDAQGKGGRAGFDTAFHDENHSFSVVELGLRPRWRVWGQELPGVYRLGSWYHSGNWEVLPDTRDEDREPRMHRGNAGVYCVGDQSLFREYPEAEDDRQGLGMFFQMAWAPSSYNKLSQYYGVGFEYVGLIPGRDTDITGLGMFHVSLSGRVQTLENRHSETAIELFHKFKLHPLLRVQPDVQYIVNPGCADRDALTVGLRFEFLYQSVRRKAPTGR